jgi:hypothetical protein
MMQAGFMTVRPLAVLVNEVTGVALIANAIQGHAANLNLTPTDDMARRVDPVFLSLILTVFVGNAFCPHRSASIRVIQSLLLIVRRLHGARMEEGVSVLLPYGISVGNVLGVIRQVMADYRDPAMQARFRSVLLR